MFKEGHYILHAVTHQLMWKPLDHDPNYVIPEFVDQNWTVRTQAEYDAMLHNVEVTVNSRITARWARKSGLSAAAAY